MNGLCECGCGGRPKSGRYLRGHATRHQYPSVAERLWARVDKTDGCWLWTGPIDKNSGYARINVSGGQRDGVHRISWRLAHGEIPFGMEVCHRCDNPLCVRPDHLFLGTSLENAQDKVAKGRQCAGARNPAARLTEAQVAEIRRRPRRPGDRQALAREFGVSVGTIKQIRAGSIWRNVA